MGSFSNKLSVFSSGEKQPASRDAVVCERQNALQRQERRLTGVRGGGFLWV